METVLQAKNMTKIYGMGSKQPFTALENIDLEIKTGEFIVVMGPSGSGKSTLIKLLLKELDPTSGEIIINRVKTNELSRRQIPYLRRNLGVVFQDFRLLKDRNVYENVAFAQRVIGVSGRKIRESVPEMLRMVGLSSKYKSFPHQLSGGEQQRVAIARALINRPAILLADEPTGNLDPHNAMEIMGLLEEINRQGTTVVVVTHSSEIVNMMRKRVITIQRGIVVGDEKESGYWYED